MSTKRKVCLAFCAVLLLGAVAAIVFLTVSLACDLKEPSEVITNGETITKTEKGIYEIYCEASAPPELNTHDFRFTDTVTGKCIVSYPPTIDSTYSLNTLIVNDEIKRGTFGRIVALVELDAGTYTVNFAPPPAKSSFVWGDDKFTVMFKYIFSIFILSVIMLVSFAGIILALDKKLKKPLPLE